MRVEIAGLVMILAKVDAYIAGRNDGLIMHYMFGNARWLLKTWRS